MQSTRLQLKLYKNKHFFSQQTKIGRDTELHTVSRHSTSRNVIYDFIEKHPATLIAKMATTTNDVGDIPLDEVAKNPLLDLKSKQDIITHVMKIIIHHQHIKPLTELLNIDDVLKRYPDYSNPGLIENLKLACEIVNEIRSSILFSSTHADFNLLEKSTQVEVLKRTEMMRNMLKEYVEQKDAEKCSVENIYALIKRFKTANCGETSAAGIHLLKQKATKSVDARRIRLQNGDHSTFIFGTNLTVNPNHYNNPDTDVVFCDAWFGQVGKFYRDDIVKQLGSCRQLRSPDKLAARFVTTFNPDYHQFSFSPFWYIDPIVKEKTTHTGLKFFDIGLPPVIYVQENKASNYQLRS